MHSILSETNKRKEGDSMTKYQRINIEILTEAIRTGMTPNEVALTQELNETRGLLYEAFAAMTPTAACKSVVYSDISRYLDGITDDYLKEESQ